uniref:Ankyrin repeat and SOCS box containing 11 n=1 Tax=Neolamprologus brichardi TaxID=32507 RepID=A0A3Q4GFR0_NEOBR
MYVDEVTVVVVFVLSECGNITNLILCVSDFWSDRTPLHEAAFQGRLLHLRALIAQAMAVSTDGATPLFNSCSSGSAACLKLILQHSASIHTTYQLASPIHEAAKKDHRECLELLLSRGAQIDLELPDVGTPLYSACMARAAACVEVLLYSGADVQIGCGPDSPLHAAVLGGGADVVHLLLDFGADGCRRNAEAKTPLDLSKPNSSVRAALLSRGVLLSCHCFILLLLFYIVSF